MVYYIQNKGIQQNAPTSRKRFTTTIHQLLSSPGFYRKLTNKTHYYNLPTSQQFTIQIHYYIPPNITKLHHPNLPLYPTKYHNNSLLRSTTTSHQSLQNFTTQTYYYISPIITTLHHSNLPLNPTNITTSHCSNLPLHPTNYYNTSLLKPTTTFYQPHNNSLPKPTTTSYQRYNNILLKFTTTSYHHSSHSTHHTILPVLRQNRS